MNEQMTAGAQASNGDYALGFQPDGVQLLHRAGDDWAELGKVAFDGDLRGGLGDFARRLHHANAPGLSLVIPDDQILYADLVLPAAANMAESLRAGLEGLTPYAVEDLAFDYAPADARPGSVVKIAAVARQTLQEAEDFAVRHGFAPDRFLAVPASTKFPYEPDFGATELAAEWELAADLTETDPASLAGGQFALDLPAPGASDLAEAPARAILAAPVLTRITPHLVAVPAKAAPPAEAATPLVNLGSIILPDEVAVSATAHMAVLPDPAAVAAPAAPVAALRMKPMSERARAFHERAIEARRNRIEEGSVASPAPPAATPRGAAAAVVAAGRRSGLTGALPMVGILILGLGIAAVLTAREPAPEPQIDEPLAAEMAPVAVPGPASAGAAGPIPAAPGMAAETVTATAPVATAPAEALPSENLPEASVSAGMAPVEVTPDVAAAPSPATSAPPPAANTATPVELPSAPPPAVAAAATEAAKSSTAAPAPVAAAPKSAPAAPKANARPRASSPAPAATTRSARPKARPTSPARTNTSSTKNSAAAAPATSRPASRPAAATSSRSGTSRAPGAPDSATLKSSVRPKTAPARSTPAASSAAPDPRPAVPRNPQPFERRALPEPSGSRPPPKPTSSTSAQGAALHLQPAPRHMALFSASGQGALLARLDQPWLAGPTIETGKPVRYAEARPTKRPGRSDAVSDAVAEAMATDDAPRPAAKASKAAPATTPAPPAAAASTAATSTRSTRLSGSARPAPRPGSRSVSPPASQSASTAGLSAATNAAVEEAMAASATAAVSAAGTSLALVRSARPAPRGKASAASDKNDSKSATDDAVSAALADGGGARPEGTLAPEPVEKSGVSKEEAEAAALAERRRLDDELQRQAEQRMRNRAAADAQAAAQAKAAAEARARAQAEAEAAAAARSKQTYRPPEIDNEPEVAAQPKGTTSQSVASAATAKGFDMNATQLIGTVGAGKASRGLVRLSNGRVVTVRLGDKINGGSITSIGNGGLKYAKGGREYTLPILNGR